MRCDRIAKDHSVPTMYPINFIHSHGICWLNLIRSNGEHKAYPISTRVNSIFTVSTRQEIMSNQQKKPKQTHIGLDVEKGTRRVKFHFISNTNMLSTLNFAHFQRIPTKKLYFNLISLFNYQVHWMLYFSGGTKDEYGIFLR